MSHRMARRAFAGLLAALCAAVVAPAPSLAQKPTTNRAATPTSRENEKNKVAWNRHKTILAWVAKGDMDLVFLGDSITQQWGGNGQKNTGMSIWNKRYEPIKAANLGVGADSTQHALWRITKGGELKGLKPKLVVLMIGINNVNNGNSAKQIAEGHAAIIKAIQDNDAGTKVLLMGTLPAKPKVKKNGKVIEVDLRAKVKDLNAQLAKLADGDKVRFLDIGSKFVDAKGNLSGGGIGGDNLHLSPKGYQIWADAIQPTIDELVGKAPNKPTPPKPTPAGKRTRWVHSEGEVVLKGKGVWVEKFKTGGTFNFVEKATTADHVELYDKSRDYTVRLTATEMLIKGGKGNVPKFATFTKQRDGKWADGGTNPAPLPSTTGKLAWGQKVSPEFRVKVVAIAKEIGVDPSHLMACMAFESGETFKPDIVNPKSGAVGLIQFTDIGIKGLRPKTTRAELKKMTAVEQLDYVRKYFLSRKGKIKNIDDLYMAILYPIGVGKPDDFVLMTRGDKKTGNDYHLNDGLDKNKDGKITKAEACAPVRAKLTKGLSDKLASPLP